jgi:group II intron reverse transcriptase/maturase
MYVATKPDREWLLVEQSKLHARSRENAAYVFRKLWGLVTDPRNLRIAVARVAQNHGARTAGVDGVTVRTALANGIDVLVAEIRAALRTGVYRPSPVRRVLIPKRGQPGKFRPLGIPTVKDRIVQAAVKHIMEPIFEADFYPSSHGFRPCKSTHGALEQLRMLLRPRDVQRMDEVERRLPYQWAIEGDIKGCFDNIDHHGLMERVRRRVGDPKVNRLVVAFLKAGVLSEGQFLRGSDAGTPQGGILSPLLANIALSVLDERYERWVWPRMRPYPLSNRATIQKRASANRNLDRTRGRSVFYPVRYADDFIVLVAVPPGVGREERAKEAALHEKAAISTLLKDTLGLDVSEEKTLVTPVTSRMKFLGHHVCVRPHPTGGRMVSTAVIPRERTQRLRELIKDLFRERTCGTDLESRLNKLNPLIRGWAMYYRHAWGAKRVFSRLDNYVWWTIFRWLRKKHPRVGRWELARRYAWRKANGRSLRWRGGNVTCFRTTTIHVGVFNKSSLGVPDFAERCGEPDA